MNPLDSADYTFAAVDFGTTSGEGAYYAAIARKHSVTLTDSVILFSILDNYITDGSQTDKRTSLITFATPVQVNKMKCQWSTANAAFTNFKRNVYYYIATGTTDNEKAYVYRYSYDGSANV